jgi:hypothetical protein
VVGDVYRQHQRLTPGLFDFSGGRLEAAPAARNDADPRAIRGESPRCSVPVLGALRDAEHRSV